MTKAYSPTWRLISVIVLRPLLTILIRNKWQGTENIPRKGPVVFVPNHVSYVDWGTDALFFQANGRYPTFMIKASMFKVKGIGPFLYKAGQLPVHRGRADAALVLKQAEQALADGAAVVVYPESTATRDPDLWPMVAKTGVARLALTSGAPVIPVAHWGTHDILRYGSKDLKLFPRKTVRTVAGPPVDLSKWAGSRLTGTVLREATAAIMGEVTTLVGQLRGEQPPAVPYDPAPPPSRTSPRSTITAGSSPSVPPQGQADGPATAAASAKAPRADAQLADAPLADSSGEPSGAGPA